MDKLDNSKRVSNSKVKEFLILGISVFLGLSVLGYFIALSPTKFKQFERSVNVKGLSEREVLADVVIWPITFSAASNRIEELYQSLEEDTGRILSFLESHGFTKSAITINPPAVIDKVARNYGNQTVELRYLGQQTVTVYTDQIERVRHAKSKLAELGKSGIVFVGNDYEGATEYIFTGLNTLKPKMVEEATRNAREVALKFAQDSDSELGKIKAARQGQFSITNRDKNNPHLKKVRVVSTIEYYLSD